MGGCKTLCKPTRPSLLTLVLPTQFNSVLNVKALVGAFNQEKALVGAFSVIVQPVVEPMEHYTVLVASVLVSSI